MRTVTTAAAATQPLSSRSTHSLSFKWFTLRVHGPPRSSHASVQTDQRDYHWLGCVPNDKASDLESMDCKHLSDVPRCIEQLASSGRSHGRGWSLAQIADHLARSMDATMRSSAARGAGPHGPRRWLKWVLRECTLVTGWIPKGLPTTKAVTPPADVRLEDALVRLQRAISEIESWTADPPIHPFLGPMSRGRWIRFHLIHARHHLRTVS